MPIGDEALSRLLAKTDAVLFTHTHRDHWDAAAIESITKATPVYCQPEDEARIRDDRFGEIVPVVERLEWRGIELTGVG